MNKKEANTHLIVGLGDAFQGKQHNISWLIDVIYDDFESRTCENCKYWSYTVDIFGECEVGVTLNSLTDTIETFGCNKFERK